MNKVSNFAPRMSFAPHYILKNEDEGVEIVLRIYYQHFIIKT